MFQQRVAIVRGPAIKKTGFRISWGKRGNATYIITGNDLYYIFTEEGEKSEIGNFFTDRIPSPYAGPCGPDLRIKVHKKSLETRKKTSAGDPELFSPDPEPAVTPLP